MYTAVPGTPIQATLTLALVKQAHFFLRKELRTCKTAPKLQPSSHLLDLARAAVAHPGVLVGLIIHAQARGVEGPLARPVAHHDHAAVLAPGAHVHVVVTPAATLPATLTPCPPSTTAGSSTDFGFRAAAAVVVVILLDHAQGTRTKSENKAPCYLSQRVSPQTNV